MREPLTAGALFERCGSALALQWIRGRSGAERTIQIPAATAGVTLPCALVGHLNLAYPNQIQVLVDAELHYLHNLGKNSHRDAIRRLFELTPAAVIVA